MKRLDEIINRLEKRYKSEVTICKALDNDDAIISYSCRTHNKFNTQLKKDIKYLKAIHNEK